jgi:hypothetical protein
VGLHTNKTISEASIGCSYLQVALCYTSSSHVLMSTGLGALTKENLNIAFGSATVEPIKGVAPIR